MKSLIVNSKKAGEGFKPRTEYVNLYLSGSFDNLLANEREPEREGIRIAIHRDENGDFTITKIAEF